MAQIDNTVLLVIITVVLAVFGTIIGVIYWVVKSRDKFITKDVCEAKQDCVESELKNIHFRLTEIRDDMKAGFAELKEAKN